MKNIFVFPGQGAHVNKISLLKNYDNSLYCTELDIISDAFGFDVLDFACSADANTLNMVKYTQLIMFASSIAFLQIAKKNNIFPNLVAGHSIGQFSAMYAAGCFNLYDLACLIKRRADLMSEVSTIGKLCAIKAPFSIDLEIVQNLCYAISENSGRVLSISLYNSENQIVVGGDVEAISSLMITIEKQKLRYTCVLLPVGQAFHTNLMASMLKPFSEYLDKITISKPNIPIILNTTGNLYSGENLKQELLDHCIKPVMWIQTMTEILQISNSRIFEVGLGHTLSGFFRNASKVKIVTMEDKKVFFNSIMNE